MATVPTRTERISTTPTQRGWSGPPPAPASRPSHAHPASPSTRLHPYCAPAQAGCSQPGVPVCPLAQAQSWEPGSARAAQRLHMRARARRGGWAALGQLLRARRGSCPHTATRGLAPSPSHLTRPSARVSADHHCAECQPQPYFLLGSSKTPVPRKPWPEQLPALTPPRGERATNTVCRWVPGQGLPHEQQPHPAEVQ